MEALRSGPVPCGIHAEGLSSYKKGIITFEEGQSKAQDGAGFEESAAQLGLEGGPAPKDKKKAS